MGYYDKRSWQTPQDCKEWRTAKDAKRSELMTDDEQKMIDQYICTLNMNVGQMNDLIDEWEEIEELYKNDQAEIKNRPNTKINVFHANIEGQISALVEPNLSVMTRGESPSDRDFAEWARIGLDWILRKNKIRRKAETHERRRLKFGSAWFKVTFDSEAEYGYGLPTIDTPALDRVFIDGKVKDPLRYQEAEYIAEVITMSQTQIVEMYGEEKASAIEYGEYSQYDDLIYEFRISEDDQNIATVIQWWSRHNGCLRLQEFSACGVLLWDSHKKGDRTDNQLDSEFKHESFYGLVDDRYPYFFTPLYPQEGNIYGFGDGKLLKPLQNMINDMYDKIRIAAKPHLILFDPESEVDLDEFEQDSFTPIPCYNPTRAVHTVAFGVINKSWWRLLASFHTEMQRVSRFSELMTSGMGGAGTATEAAIQQQQGNAATTQKKLTLQETLQDVSTYALGLAMEFYTEEKAFRITEDKEEYAWIDFRKLAKIPVKKPTTEEYRKEYIAKQQKAGVKSPKVPEWIILEDKNGNALTKNIELDIEINIGTGLPKNKAFLFQMLQQIVPLQAEGKPIMTWKEVRNFLTDFLGLPLETVEEIEHQAQMQQQQQMMAQQLQAQAQMGAETPEALPNPNEVGVSQGGSPQATQQQGQVPMSGQQAPTITGK